MPPIFSLILRVAGIVCFGISVWRSSQPDWNKIFSVGMPLFAASFLSW